uniref:Neuropeptide-Like Protein n=1 Tax=Haemonchus contortus TaxID=6289 RepID=A0A7I5ECB3_HAECO|nr:Protein NLP-9, isoform b [Haemonchus contortus]
MPSSSTYAALLTIVLLVCLSAAQNSENYPSLAKRGGARAFHGYFNMPSSKRLSGEYPYYLYEKRGGGRAFFGGWQPYESLGARFYENPYYKRSSSLWEFLEDRNAL